MNDPWEAAKTATVMVGFSTLAVLTVLGLIQGVGRAIEGLIVLTRRIGPRRAGLVMTVGTVTFLWAFVFLVTWCCGIPR